VAVKDSASVAQSTDSSKTDTSVFPIDNIINLATLAASSLCDTPAQFRKEDISGFLCFNELTEIPLGLSILGETRTECINKAGSWAEISCENALDFLNSSQLIPFEGLDSYRTELASLCCDTTTAPPSLVAVKDSASVAQSTDSSKTDTSVFPIDNIINLATLAASSLCDTPAQFRKEDISGFLCFNELTEIPLGLSILGETRTECINKAGSWAEISCENALDFLNSSQLIPFEGLDSYRTELALLCCEQETKETGYPTVSPGAKVSKGTPSDKALTDAPTLSFFPTKAPMEIPTPQPTKAPTEAPTPQPTKAPTKVPTPQPTKSPTEEPTTVATTGSPTTEAPTKSPVQSTGMCTPISKLLKDKCDAMENFWKSAGGDQWVQGGLYKRLWRSACCV